MANEKKTKVLGMPYGTANARLRKNILFHLLKKYGENICFQCSKPIDTPDELSIEHKKAWLNNDVALFWDLDNIAFSHLKCNCAAAINPYQIVGKHPSILSYAKGCRCDECKEVHRNRISKQRKRRSLIKE